MKHIKVILITMILCMIPCIAFAGDDPCSGVHTWVDSYEIIDGSYHNIISTCSVCGTTKEKKKMHDWNTSGYEIIDDSKHYVVSTCACGAEKKTERDHYWGSTYTYETIDESTHYQIQTCICSAERRIAIKHDWSGVPYKYEYTDDSCHKAIYKCSKCTEEKTRDQRHDLSSDISYERIDDSKHYKVGQCSKCKEVIKTEQDHVFNNVEYTPIDDQTHSTLRRCAGCGSESTVLQNHKWTKQYKYEACDQAAHYSLHECEYCAKIGKFRENHKLYNKTVIRYATPAAAGAYRSVCDDCRTSVTIPIPWQRFYPDCLNYDLDHTRIFPKTKSVTVYLENPLKGGVVSVKVGKKTYKKTLTDNSTVVKIKIKKPKKYGQKVNVQLLYNGQLVGYDQCEYDDFVYYAKKIKRGMTKKQAKYTWGYPYSITKTSGGYEHWHYRNGDYLRFRRGKVDAWRYVN